MLVQVRTNKKVKIRKKSTLRLISNAFQHGSVFETGKFGNCTNFGKVSKWNTTSIAFLLQEYQTLSNTPQTFLTSGLHIAFKIIYAKSYISQ